MSLTVYTFTVHPSNAAASNWFTQASEHDLKGTIEEAQALARELESPITLTDAAGFPRGRVQADGNYRLA